MKSQHNSLLLTFGNNNPNYYLSFIEKSCTYSKPQWCSKMPLDLNKK